jgi:hypothetical protein
MLLSGITAAVVTAPLFDRVLTRHLGVTIRTLVPIVAAAWLSLIWAGAHKSFEFYDIPLRPSSRLVRPHNTAGLFVIVTVLGVGSIILLPIGLELACEVTRNADGSSAILWFLCVINYFFDQLKVTANFSANVFGIVFPLSASSLILVVPCYSIP